MRYVRRWWVGYSTAFGGTVSLESLYVISCRRCMQSGGCLVVVYVVPGSVVYEGVASKWYVRKFISLFSKLLKLSLFEFVYRS